jgi:hypothetical protein
MLVSTKDRPACARLRKEAKQMSYPTIESTIGNTPLIQLRASRRKASAATTSSSAS